MLPPDWWYFLNEHGEGKKVDFPMKIKPVLGWSPKCLQWKENCARTKVSC